MDTTVVRVAGPRRRPVGNVLPITLMVDRMLMQYKGAHIMAKHSKKSQTGQQAGRKEETPADAFARLATGRTNKAIKSILLIGQLTGSAYESTDVQRRAIIQGLQAMLDHVKDVFEGKGKADDKFRLPS